MNTSLICGVCSFFLKCQIWLFLSMFIIVAFKRHYTVSYQSLISAWVILLYIGYATLLHPFNDIIISWSWEHILTSICIRFSKKLTSLCLCVFFLTGCQLLSRSGGPRCDYSRSKRAHNAANHFSPGSGSWGKVPYQVQVENFYSAYSWFPEGRGRKNESERSQPGTSEKMNRRGVKIGRRFACW